MRVLLVTMRPSLRLPALLLFGAGMGLAGGKADKVELQEDLKDSAIAGDWNYDDIDGAFARAAREKKPVCIVFR